MTEANEGQMPVYPIIDIHTHVYPDSYLSLLRSRTTVPYIYDPPDGSPARLIILSSDDSPSIPKEKRGRPVDSSYSDISLKLAFMRKHNITTSVISLANPWLDFLPAQDACRWAERINNDLESICAEQNAKAEAKRNSSSTGETLPLNEFYSLFAFGALPLSAPDPNAIVNEISRLASLMFIRGVIMGTSGLGSGLDDPALDPVWAALERTRTLLFLHPHYGLPNAAFGGDETVERYGHVLPLALGFPLETTIAVTRMYLAGVFDRFPKLGILLAHSGGTLPFLAGRIESCVAHERKFLANGGNVAGPKKSLWDVLNQNIYLDAVIYGEAGLRAAVHGAGSVDRVLFGTDHPFFPPLDGKDKQWLSVVMNQRVIDGAFGAESDTAKAILGGNAVKILNLES
ncbi:uracil-5-carboxylate decarboxylase [Blastomyces gilchristii SLH14081]|uniref:Uracil-5-carboxylate decarboxylase n=1 Tax=Blastomyces gilchristii (strain SLH14081) TaxID=559298 RepID=A0A179UXZ3_BLAGS|nr:uracil-5-carboxylate decarboxylase [Blastomyces gilchristii SLH14081]OAT12954.1 uracil-5-carboxylate decarboxylase [Blastomyces gilchristii SLH14081]